MIDKELIEEKIDDTIDNLETLREKLSEIEDEVILKEIKILLNSFNEKVWFYI